MHGGLWTPKARLGSPAKSKHMNLDPKPKPETLNPKPETLNFRNEANHTTLSISTLVVGAPDEHALNELKQRGCADQTTEGVAFSGLGL